MEKTLCRLILDDDQDIVDVRGDEHFVFLATDSKVAQVVGGVHGLHGGLGPLAKVRNQAGILKSNALS